MGTQSFKDLVVWQKSANLTLEIYKVFGGLRDFGFKDQIQRASVSATNNIAEDCAGRSDISFRPFLLIARGYVAGVESMPILAEKLSYVNSGDKDKPMFMTDETSRLLSGFIRKLSAED